MPIAEPVADGAALAGWAPVVDDPALEALLRPGAVMHRLATGAVWSEGPVWLPEDGSVMWSDIPNDRLLRWYADGRVSVFLQPAEFENGHTLDHDGSIVGCSHGNRRVERVTLDGSLIPIVERYLGKRFNSPNDVVIKSDGTIWFTDPPYGIASDHEGHKAESEIGDCLVFRYDPPTGALDAVTDWVEHPNGLAFSLDESILYVSDTSGALPDLGGTNHHIVAFDVVDGRRLADPRVFYVMDEGFADGFRIDAEGNVWTSAEDGIHVVAPDGRRLGRLPIPERTSNCVFGGPNGDRLFITASSSLYAIDVATRGAVPAPRRATHETREGGPVEAIEALLRQAEQAHGVYEGTVLKGVYDREWPRWYAMYAVEHGIGELVDHPVEVDDLAQFLATSWNDFERASPMPTEPWATYIARRIAEGI